MDTKDSTEEDEIIIRIIKLIAQAESALAQNNLKEANDFLVEIKSYAQSKA
jgi:hypothetical protein